MLDYRGTALIPTVEVQITLTDKLSARMKWARIVFDENGRIMMRKQRNKNRTERLSKVVTSKVD